MNQFTPTADRLARLRGLPHHLANCIRGQDQVIAPLAGAIIRSQLSLTKFPRFFLAGPTGTGKTELTKAFSTYLHDGELGRLHRIDCSEYGSPDSVIGFLGGAKGTPGRLASLKLERGDTFLFDELEKAHRTFLDLLLQLLEPGQLMLASGRVVDVSACYIVCTSNIASHEILDVAHATFATVERHVLRRAETVLRPEIFNRFDETLVFRPLEYEIQVEIIGQKLAAYLDPLRAKGWRIEVDETVSRFLVRHGFDRRMGARPLMRAIDRYVGNALAAQMLAGGRQEGTLRVSASGEELMLVEAKGAGDGGRIEGGQP